MGLPAYKIITIKAFKTPISHAMGLPAWKHSYHYKAPISHAIGLPANKIVTIKHPFHMQWAYRQTKLSLSNTHFTCSGPAGKHNYHHKSFKNTHFRCNGPAYKQNHNYKTPISHAVGLPINKVITIKHPFHMQWACWQIKLSL